MPLLVVTGAIVQCAGAVPPGIASFVANPGTVKGMKVDVGTKMQFTPANMATFGMCNLPANPTVAAATSAALGVLTPMPCVPAIAAPWMPGAMKVKINKIPALHDGCTANCSYGGLISVKFPGQVKVKVK